RSFVSTPSQFVNTGYGAGYINSPWVARLDLTTNTLDSAANAGDPAAGVAITPDGSRAYAAVPRGNRVAVIDMASNTVLATIAVGTGPSGVAIAAPIGKRGVRSAGSRRP